MNAAQVVVKMRQDKLTVQVIGRTAKGQKFVKGEKVLAVKSLADPEFKAEMSKAVNELLGSNPRDVQFGMDLADRS